MRVGCLGFEFNSFFEHGYFLYVEGFREDLRVEELAYLSLNDLYRHLRSSRFQSKRDDNISAQTEPSPRLVYGRLGF